MSLSLRIMLALLICGPGFIGTSNGDEPPAPAALPRVAPLEPADAGESFRLQDGFSLQLVAAEPLVTDPVAGTFDENGRLYVVEMNDYPYTDKSTDKPNVERTNDLPIGKVRLLEDTDDDGVFDKGTVFARDLSWPTGIAVYRGGVFVAATPDVWYLKDADGNGEAEIREKVFTGFRKFNVQAVVNNLIWGLDHRIYGAGGSNGGSIASPEHPDQEKVVIIRHDFRFDPRDRKLELQSGSARFGNTFDDWGRRFICNIRNPIQHVVLPQQYLERNPFLPVSSALHDVAVSGDQIRVFRASPPEPWRVVNALRLTSQGDPRTPRSEKNAAGYMTSACGVTVYRGDAYPPELRQQVFLAEPSGNLVHRQRLTPSGVTFTSQRIDQDCEFLASTDNWFRPVNFVPAPDGTLYLLDMYRETIEHPWSMPDDLKALLDLENGRDRGRIYRITPPHFSRRKTPRLRTASTAELVNLLAHPNAWHRDTAHRLLFERQEDCAALLRELRDETKSAVARLHVLWSLHGLGKLSQKDLETALGDSASGVREHGVLLAEEYLRDHEGRDLTRQLLALADDGEPGVRFQTAFTLGSIEDPRRIEKLEGIARRDADDLWISVAVLSSAADLAPTLLSRLLADNDFRSVPQRLTLLKQLAQSTGARNKSAELHAIGQSIANLPADAADLRLSVMLALDDGLRRCGSRVDIAWMETPAPAGMLRSLIASSEKTLLNADASLPQRLIALRLITCQMWNPAGETLLSIVAQKQPQELQVAAIRAAAGYHSDDLAARLLEIFPISTPAVQYEIIEALANHPQRVPVLLDAIADGTISAGQVTPIRRTLLLGHSDAQIRQVAVALLGSDRATPRSEVVKAYQPAISPVGEATRGGKVFLRECASCHRLGEAGYDVGPNLATVRHRRADEILIAILDPNREVGPNFLQFAVTLDDGRVLTGMIAEESAVSLTLRRAENKQEVVLRQNIDEVRGTGLSLMPEGLEKTITQQDMADLLAYLRDVK